MRYLKKYESWSDNSLQLVELELIDVINLLSEEAVASSINVEEEDEYTEEKIESFYNKGDYYENDGIKLTIKTTKHWLERLYRKSDRKYANNDKIFNPTKDEGLDLLFKNIDRVINFIKKMNSNNKKTVYLEMLYENAEHEGKKVPYSQIISVEPKKGKRYELTLITQIKGERLYSKNYNTMRVKITESYIFESNEYKEKIFNILKSGDDELALTLCKSLGVDFGDVLFLLMSDEYNCLTR